MRNDVVIPLLTLYIKIYSFTNNKEGIAMMINYDLRVKFNYIERPIESIVSPYDTELFEIIEEETRTIFPDSVTVPHLVIYGTDSRFFRRKGASCYGFFPGPVTMEEYKTIHGNDERIREKSLRTAVRIYYNVVKNFCEEKK